MRRAMPVLTLALPFLAACGGAGAPSGPPSLAYELPTMTSATYVQGDTARVEIDMGGQMMDMTVSSGATLAMTFASAGDGVQVTASFEDFSATATNPMGPPQTASGSQVSGNMVFNLDRRGRTEFVEGPELEGLAEQFLTPAAMAATLFPRLPGRAVAVGDMWTDTVDVNAQQSTGSTSAHSVVTFTVAGDTTVAGRSLLKVTFTSDDTQHTEGAQAGFDVVQDLSGESEGHFLWDMAAGMVYESVTESDLTGNMNVSAAPFPLSVAVRSTSTLRLQDGGM